MAKRIHLQDAVSVEDSFFEDLALISRTTPLVEYTSRYSDRELGTIISRVVRGGKKYGYIDPTGEFFIPPKFSQAMSFSEGLAAVAIRGKWGYIDKEGNWTIEPNFENVKFFSEGLAAVRLHGQWGFINTKGERVIEALFDKVESFSEGLAKVSLNNNQVAYINVLGQIVFKFFGEYDDYGDFFEGLAEAKHSSGNWGYIDKEGKWAIEPNFEFTMSFSEGLAAVRLHGQWGFINREGEQIIEPQFEFAIGFSEGLAGVQDVKSGRWGFINTKGEWAIEPQFEFASLFSEGVAVVKSEKKSYGYINKHGEWLMGPKFKYARHFSNGRALVSYNGSKWFFVQVTNLDYLPEVSNQIDIN